MLMSAIGRAAIHDSCFHVREAPRELVVGLSQGGFRLDAQPPREVSDREQQVAHLLFGPIVIERGIAGHDLCDLVDLFPNLLDDVGRPVPVEADGVRAHTDLIGAKQRRSAARNAAQQGRWV